MASDLPADVAGTIDTAGVGPLQRTVFVLCFCAIFVDGFDLQILPFTAAAILKDLAFAPSLLGALVSASLLGMVASGLICGILADRFGRRPVILGGMFVFGLFTLVKIFARSYETLLVFQFVTGMGLGATFNNLISLSAEYAPLRNRRLILTVVSSSYSLGGIAASYVTAALLVRIGWRGVFVCGAVAAFAILALLFARLPESVRQLAMRGAPRARIIPIMARIAPAAAREWTTTERRPTSAPLRHLFDGERRVATIVLAAAVMLSLMSGYFVISWSPLLFGMAGVSPGRAAIAAGMLQTGSVVGSLLWGRLTDRFWPPAMLAAAAAVSTVCYAALGHVVGTYPLLIAVALIAGMGMGVQNAYNAFVAALYPTAIRGTAFGTIIGIGRMGSIAGPLLGGAMLAAGWPIARLYYLPAAIAAGMILCMAVLTIARSSRKLVAASFVRSSPARP